MPNAGILRTAFSRSSGQWPILRYTLVYIVLSCLWIGFSDKVLYWTVSDPALLTTFSMIKGWLFVGATALLWYGLMVRNASKISSSQSAYRTLIHASPVPIAVMRIADGMYLEVNDSFVKLSGFNKDEIIGHSIFELGFYPDDEVRADILQILKKDGRLRASDRQFRSRSGELIDTLLWVEPISLGEDPLVLALALDLTDRKRAEGKLRESEQRFATVFRASPICISLTRLSDGKFLDVNDEFLSLLGYRREDVIDSDPVSLNMWTDPDDRMKMLTMLGEKGRTQSIDTRFRTKSGKIKQVKVIAELIDIGREKYILGLSEDITARKKIEADLERENYRNKMLLRVASDGIHVLDLSGNVLEVSDSFCTMLGYTRDELRSMNVRDWDVKLGYDELMANFRSFRNSKDSIRIMETRHRRKDGTIVDVEISSTSAAVDGKEIVYASARDISERKLAEGRLIKSEAELNRLRKAVETSNEIVFLTDKEGTFTYVNPEFTRVYGYNAVEIIGISTPRILKGGALTEEDYGSFWQTLISGKMVRRELVNKAKGGRLIFVEISVSPVFSEAGALDGFLAIEKRYYRTKTGRRIITPERGESCGSPADRANWQLGMGFIDGDGCLVKRALKYSGATAGGRFSRRADPLAIFSVRYRPRAAGDRECIEYRISLRT